MSTKLFLSLYYSKEGDKILHKPEQQQPTWGLLRNLFFFALFVGSQVGNYNDYDIGSHPTIVYKKTSNEFDIHNMTELENITFNVEHSFKPLPFYGIFLPLTSTDEELEQIETFINKSPTKEDLKKIIKDNLEMEKNVSHFIGKNKYTVEETLTEEVNMYLKDYFKVTIKDYMGLLENAQYFTGLGAMSLVFETIYFYSNSNLLLHYISQNYLFDWTGTVSNVFYTDMIVRNIVQYFNDAEVIIKVSNDQNKYIEGLKNEFLIGKYAKQYFTVIVPNKYLVLMMEVGASLLINFVWLTLNETNKWKQIIRSPQKHEYSFPHLKYIYKHTGKRFNLFYSSPRDKEIYNVYLRKSNTEPCIRNLTVDDFETFPQYLDHAINLIIEFFVCFKEITIEIKDETKVIKLKEIASDIIDLLVLDTNGVGFHSKPETVKVLFPGTVQIPKYLKIEEMEQHMFDYVQNNHYFKHLLNVNIRSYLSKTPRLNNYSLKEEFCKAIREERFDKLFRTKDELPEFNNEDERVNNMPYIEYKSLIKRFMIHYIYFVRIYPLIDPYVHFSLNVDIFKLENGVDLIKKTSELVIFNNKMYFPELAIMETPKTTLFQKMISLLPGKFTFRNLAAFLHFSNVLGTDDTIKAWHLMNSFLYGFFMLNLHRFLYKTFLSTEESDIYDLTGNIIFNRSFLTRGEVFEQTVEEVLNDDKYIKEFLSRPLYIDPKHNKNLTFDEDIIYVNGNIEFKNARPS